MPRDGACSIGVLLKSVELKISTVWKPEPSRATEPSDRYAIRDPVGLAIAARSMGKLPATDAGLHLGLALAARAIEKGKRPTALFWHLLSLPDPASSVTAANERQASFWITSARIDRNAPVRQPK